MKLNKKGFAVSTILYALLIIFLLLIVLIFTLFDSTNGLFSKALKDITNPDGEWALATATINTGSYVSFEEEGVTKYQIPSDPDEFGTLPTIELPENYTQELTSETVINPYIPGDYPITYTIKDENGEALPEPERTLTINVPEPTYSAVMDSNPGSYDGTGTSGDPYLIKSIEDLIGLSNNVAAGNTYSGKYFKLVNNLDFNNNDSYYNYQDISLGDLNGNAETESIKTELTTGKGFLPIGGSTYKFNGIFNGNFKSINNLFINRPAENYVGLFGGKTAGIIKHLNLYNVNVTGGPSNSFTGGLVGYTEANVINCNVLDGSVTGTTNVGLAIGYSKSNIRGVVVRGNVYGTNYVGGIVGALNTGATHTVVRGVNIGGAIDGIGGNTCSNCYRVAGYSSTAPTALSTLFFSVFSYPSVTINDAVASTTSVSYSFNGANIDSINDLDNINAVNMVYDTYILGDDDSDGYYFDYFDNSSNAIVFKSTEEAPIIFNLSGAGTVGDPYIINNYSDLKMATTNITGFTYYSISENIDLAGKNFYMFGTIGDKYNSLIHGNAKKLSNIIIDVPAASLLGFTARNTGYIRGLYIENITIIGQSFVGGFAGINAGTITNNVLTGGIVSGTSRVGLGTGQNNGTFTSSIFEGTATGSEYIGGVVGYVNASLTKSVYRDGEVKFVNGSSPSYSGRVFGGSGGTLTDKLYNYALKTDSKILVNNVLITHTSYAQKHGKDASLVELADLTIYANAGFNTTDESASAYYIWYIDNGVVKFRKTTGQ